MLRPLQGREHLGEVQPELLVAPKTVVGSLRSVRQLKGVCFTAFPLLPNGRREWDRVALPLGSLAVPLSDEQVTGTA